MSCQRSTDTAASPQEQRRGKKGIGATGNPEIKDSTDPFQKEGRIKMQLCFFEGYLRANQGGLSLPIGLETYTRQLKRAL